jgi:sulfur carrier protein
VELQVETPEYVTVELNGEILERDNFPAIIVKNGDAVEFLYFMGGGR